MWGIVPAAGRGTRIQPLACSKELLPVGSRARDGRSAPCAVAEYLVERLVRGGVDRLCFVIGPGKSDILEYFGGSWAGVDIAYVVQPEAAGLCDAIFRAQRLVGPSERVAIGLPDTIWFPDDAIAALGDDALSFLLFPVDHPERFDAVITDDEARVVEIRVKQIAPGTSWIWGAFAMSGEVFHALHRLWLSRTPRDEYFGTLVNAWIAAGGVARGRPLGERYIDVGTLDGYREAITLLAREERTATPPIAAAPPAHLAELQP